MVLCIRTRLTETFQSLTARSYSPYPLQTCHDKRVVVEKVKSVLFKTNSHLAKEKHAPVGAVWNDSGAEVQAPETQGSPDIDQHNGLVASFKRRKVGFANVHKDPMKEADKDCIGCSVAAVRPKNENGSSQAASGTKIVPVSKPDAHYPAVQSVLSAVFIHCQKGS